MPDDAQHRPADVTSARLRSAIRGDADAAGWIVERFSPLLRADAAYRLGPKLRGVCDPEDVAAEVWAVALPRLGKLPPRDGRMTPVLLRFLTTALRHVVGNLLQKHAREGRGFVSLDAGPAAAADGSSVGPPAPADDGSGVVTKAARAERRDLVLAALDALTESDRALIVLRGIEQAELSAVAAELGVPPNTVSVRYRRALDRLRAALPGSVFEDFVD